MITSIQKPHVFYLGSLAVRSIWWPFVLRLVIFVSAASLIGFSFFAAPDDTHAQRESSFSVAGAAKKQDAAMSPLLPAVGCTGANFTQPPGSPLAAGIQPRANVSADFNGDGKPDLAVGDEFSKDLIIYLGNGTGGFVKATISLGSGPVNLAVGDFNLDGKADLLAAIGSTNVLLLTGDGTGDFTTTSIAVAGGAASVGLAVADFNRDGKPDFAVTNFATNTVSIMLGNGNGSFSAASGSPFSTGIKPASAAAGDFNQDGKPDLVVSNITTNDITVLLGNGNGGFSAAPQSPVATLGNSPERVSVADLNSDGQLDLVTANSLSSNVSILLGKGDGTFQNAANSPLPVATNASSVSIADLNLDGKMDLLVSDSATDKVQLFLGDGAAAFSEASGSPITTGFSPFWAAVADFNLDGRPDFAVANRGANTVSVELNSCSAQPCGGISFTVAAGSPFSAQNRALVTADFNLDGKLDVAAVSHDTNNLSILLGNGSGGFTAAAGSPINDGAGSLSLTSGDFNRDGKPDLAVARSGSSGVSILIGNGTGAFSAPQLVGGLSITFPQWVAVADFNRDGKPDVVTVAIGGVFILLGDGAGDFAIAPNSPAATGSSPKSLVVADFNGDAKSDVAVANSGSNNVTVLLGDGTGNLNAANGPFAVGNNPWSLAVGDFNRNGKPDLAIANLSGGNVTILLDDGNDGFAPAPGSPFAAGTNPFSMAVSDLNLDGNADLVVTSSTTNNLTVLAGNGSGGFSPAIGSPVVTANSNATVAAADFNLDGRSDLAVLNNDVSGLTIHLNACPAAAPTPMPTPTPPTNLVVFSPANYGATEACTAVTITVNRTGDTSGAATVDYATSDGTATERGDYITARGTLSFAPGETSKTFAVLINDDSFVEGTETFNINLSNPSGFSLGTPAMAVVSILDNQSEPATNVNDDAQNYVCQHYHDFLNRQPDQSGWDFWTNQIASCGSDAACRDVERVNVSAAFFLSIEFQKTGFFVERIYKSAFGDANGTSSLGNTHQLAVPIVRYNDFVADAQRLARGVVVLQSGWQQVLETNTQAFMNEFVQRQAFMAAFPSSMTAAQFVDKLNTNAGNPLSQSERDQLVTDLSTNAKTRAQVLRAVAEDNDLVNAEFSRAFVLAEYFGYLRRNPNDPQDSDYSGYDFWLTKLNHFNGNYINAQMTWAFLSSAEYRLRFGP